MTVTVRDTNGTPILPVVEHFGGGRKAVDLVENPRGEGEATVGAEGGDGLGVQEQQEEQQQTGRKILDRSQRQHSERTFLDRPPPSECVEPVLPAGCTARKFSALGVCALALVRPALVEKGGVGGIRRSILCVARTLAFVYPCTVCSYCRSRNDNMAPLGRCPHIYWIPLFV